MKRGSGKRRPFYQSLYFWGFLIIAGSFILKDSERGAFVALIGVAVFIGGFVQNRIYKHAEKAGNRKKEAAKPSPEEEAVIKSGDDAGFLDRNVIYTDVPKRYCGNGLAYSYEDVWIICPDDCRPIAEKVPENYRLAARLDKQNRDNEQSAAILYRDQVIGYLRNNELKKMLFDFAVDPKRGFLILGKKWTDKPAVKLYFYKPDELTRDSYDDEDEDDDPDDDFE